MKKLSGLLLSLPLFFAVLCFFPTSAKAIDNVVQGDFEFKCIEDDGIPMEAGIWMYKGKSANVVVPDSVTFTYEAEVDGEWKDLTKEVPVTTLYYEIFRDCEFLSSVQIPSTIKMIDYGVFSGCTSLKTVGVSTETEGVFLPEGLITLDHHAFSGCSSLKKVVFPASLTFIRESTFEDCLSLNDVDMSANTITRIDHGAFCGCSSLKGITLSTNLALMDDYVFENCSALKTISLPDSVVTAGEGVFYGCRALTEIKLSDGMHEIPWRFFVDCISLTTVTLPSDIAIIDEGRFSDCERLKTVKYKGTIADWKNVIIMEGNDNLKKALIQCTDGTYHAIHTNSASVTKATISANGKIDTKCTLCGRIVSTKPIAYPQSIKLTATSQESGWAETSL